MLKLNFYDNMTVAKKAGLWFTIINIFNSGLNIITTPLFTRILTEADIGTYSVYNSWLSLFSVIVTLNLSCGVYEVLLVEKDNDKDNVSSSLASLTLLLGVCWTLIAMIFHESIEILLGMKMQYIFMMVVEMEASAIVSFYITRKKFEYSYKNCALVSIPLALLRTVSAVCLVVFVPGDKVFLRILGNVSVLVVFSLLLGPITFRHNSAWKLGKYWNCGIRNNIVLLPHYISGILLASSDRVMISRMIGDDKAGIYSIIYSFSFLVSILFNAVSSAFTPFCYKALKEERIDAIRETCFKLTISMAMICMMVTSVAPEAITVFAPKSYHEAVDLVPVLIIGALFTFLYNLFSCVEFYYHKNIFTTIATFIGAIINISLNYVFLPVLGYKVAAYTTMFGYFVMMVAHYLVSYHIMKKDAFGVKRLAEILVATICFALIMEFLYDGWIIRYLILLLLGIVLYTRKNQIVSALK